jgi:Ca-activated chloride channel homolog
MEPVCTSQFLGSEPGSGGMFGGGQIPGGGFGGGYPGGQGFGGAQGLANGFRRGIDDVTLQQVADLTGGTYHPAASAGELQSVFQGLPTNLITKNEVVEVSVVFVALGGLLAAAALFLGRAWRPLPS